MKKIERATVIVLDSLGVGYTPDSKKYGDEGANTLWQLALVTGGVNLPNMGKLGLGNIIEVLGVKKRGKPNRVLWKIR